MAIEDTILQAFYLIEANKRESAEGIERSSADSGADEQTDHSGEAIANLPTTILALARTARVPAYVFRLLAQLRSGLAVKEKLLKLLLAEDTKQETREFVAETLAHEAAEQYSNSYEILESALYKAHGVVYESIANAVANNQEAAKMLSIKKALIFTPYNS